MRMNKLKQKRRKERKGKIMEDEKKIEKKENSYRIASFSQNFVKWREREEQREQTRQGEKLKNKTTPDLSNG